MILTPKQKIWVVLRPIHTSNGEVATVGILGTGFFVSPNKFVTAYHCVNETSFTPNGEYNNTDIYILSPQEDLVKVNLEDTSFHPEVDITFIYTKSAFPYFKNKRNVAIGDSVYNVGFPSDQISILLAASPLRIITSKTKTGSILELNDNYSISSNDVNLLGKKIIIVDYLAEVGFSGGPLLSNGRVVGLMSHYHRSTNSIAVIKSNYFYSLK